MKPACFAPLLWMVLSALEVGCAEAENTLQKIAGYQPQFDMTDVLVVDMDQENMEARLIDESNEGFGLAHNYYAEGAHSLSVATLRLALPLSKLLLKGAEVTGEDEYNHDVTGILYQDASANSQVLLFQYQPKEGDTKLCRVGALPVDDQIVNGCLVREGTVNVASTGEIIAYTYDPYVDNNNGRTLQSFSLSAKTKFYECQNCPYPDFLKFREYYGKSNYADEWISAAFEGRATQFNNGNANFQFSSLSGRSEAIKKGTSHMAVWMYVIGQMEEAVSECRSGCTNCNEDSVRLWDEAVALYTGSLEGADGSGHGLLLYELADKKCINFRTCGSQRDKDSGTAAVNLEIFTFFQTGQLELSNGLCDTVRGHKERIVQLMTVPLVQGMLYYAYLNERQGDTGEKEQSAGATYAASILPMVHYCSERDAVDIWEATALASMNPNFKSVKAALERNYACLGITCVDVGGIFDDSTRSYFQDAHPCTYGGGSGAYGVTASSNTGLIVGAVVGGVLFVVCLLTCCCLPIRKRKILKKGKEMPPLEVSQAEQEAEYQRQLEEEYKRQLEEAERRQFEVAKKRDASVGNRNDKDDDDDDMEIVTLYSQSVKGLINAFDNSLV